MIIDYTALGQRIATRRKHLAIKQNELAKRVAISNHYLSGIEHGTEHPSLDVLVRLCNELRVTPDYLLMGNLYTHNVPQRLLDGLRLCSQEDLTLLMHMVDFMVEREAQQWNRENFA